MKNLTITDVRVNPGDSGFLIDDGKTAILYDTGFGFTGRAMAEKIKNILSGRNLDYIFLTHSHYDHALGSGFINQYWEGVKVVAGTYTANIFGREGAKAVMKDLDSKFAKKCGVSDADYEFPGENLRVDIPVDDGDIIEAGSMSFKTIYLPGHTKCSVGFYSEEHALLLSTETIGVYDGENIIFPSYLVSYKDTLDSIDRIKQFKIKNLLCPHYGVLNDMQTKYYLDNCNRASVELARFIADRLKDGIDEYTIREEIKKKYRRGYIIDIYPEDAADMNISIMIQLIKKENLL
ncbi:MAG: MBL fold metallo-hydrolase [Ruminococcaceae bacterium]|nr:MBL fold metallo-hydrolase [Oscillospiraceae bacterium]